MMKELGIDGISETEESSQVKITNSICPALAGMIVETPNFRELNFLSKRFQQTDKNQLISWTKF